MPAPTAQAEPASGPAASSRPGARVLDAAGVELLVVAGEASGDLHGARLLGELRQLVPALSAFGMGGGELRAAGLRAVADSAEVAVVGVVEVLRVLPRVRQVFAALLAEVDRLRPAAALLIDFPDFNLRLARRLKQRGIPVIYYVSPQVWAWRRGRVRTIARRVDEMLVLFPFEVDFYRRSRVTAVHVGHPLVDEVPQLRGVWDGALPAAPASAAEGAMVSTAETGPASAAMEAAVPAPETEVAVAARGVAAPPAVGTRAAPAAMGSATSMTAAPRPAGDEAPWRLALLPGSRRSEVESLLPVMLGAVARLAAVHPVEVDLIRAPTIPREMLAELIERFRREASRSGAAPAVGSADGPRIVSADRFAAIAASHLALCASGTATLEVGLLGTPMVVLYKLSPWSYVLAKLLVHLPNFALVNLVLGREVVPELLQGEAEPGPIAAAALRLLTDAAARERVRAGLAEVRSRLGEGGASRRAAVQVAAFLGAAAAGPRQRAAAS
jgi:lipid-A-disaccharide synthase